ncbi:hypothetical protein [Synechococcus phage DSL-LC02]|nr:hypothetical protein [Synechococcus phage DSL-LC02]
MKSFNQFLSESVTINGDFNGTLNIGGTPQQETVGEQFVADVVWQGSIYRIEMVTESGLPSKEKLTEHLQSQYPGAVVHQIYPVSETTNPYQIKDSKRYHPAKLEWI